MKPFPKPRPDKLEPDEAPWDAGTGLNLVPHHSFLKIGYKIPQRREMNTQKTPTSRTGLFLPQDTQIFGAKGLISTKATPFWIHQPASSKPYCS